jgi:RsiW-degrading membrane proteinase PrsW (M82 family)
MIANIFVLLLLAVAPSAVLLKYVLLRDKYEHEPMRLIAITFLFGALGIIPATILEILLNSPNILVDAFLVTALIEESMKYLAVRAKAYQSPDFNEVMDGIVYGVAAGLGFATVENFFMCSDSVRFRQRSYERFSQYLVTLLMLVSWGFT